RKINRESVLINSRLNGSVQEATQGIAIVKAFTLEDELARRIGIMADTAEQRNNKIARVAERLSPISEILGGLAVTAVLAYSGYRALVLGQPPGAVFSFITALILAYDPARRLARTQVGMERALVNARMIYELLDLEPKQGDAPDAVEAKVTTGEVRFNNVTFGYNADMPVLRDLSFTAAAGKVTAIVGASGAGKSTLVALLQRFYDVDQGSIEVDGQDISKVTKHSLRQSIAYVAQAPYLFEGTIRDNIRFGRLSATDNEAEARVQEALTHVMEGRTTIVIAHRLSTVVNADHIIVLEEGRLVEEGTHATLMADPHGIYARFHRIQGK
ncbi:MAG: ABC transporter ATP-binding protein, partial [Mesorhizobium sp.]